MNFLIIDDHYIVRSGMKGLFLEIHQFSTIEEAFDGDSALAKLKLHSYDLIIMDVQLPKTDTIGLMQIIKVKYPQAKVLIFSMSAESIYAKRFLKEGAKGFLSKEAPVEEMKKAIELVLNGRTYISESLGNALMDESLKLKPGKASNHFDKLSVREFEIVNMLLAGDTATGISRSLNLQLSTIGTHKTRIFQKLGITNIMELKELALFYNL